jgi:hypothetical protein
MGKKDDGSRALLPIIKQTSRRSFQGSAPATWPMAFSILQYRAPSLLPDRHPTQALQSAPQALQAFSGYFSSLQSSEMVSFASALRS